MKHRMDFGVYPEDNGESSETLVNWKAKEVALVLTDQQRGDLLGHEYLAESCVAARKVLRSPS